MKKKNDNAGVASAVKTNAFPKKKKKKKKKKKNLFLETVCFHCGRIDKGCHEREFMYEGF